MENAFELAEELLALGRSESALAELTILIDGQFGGAEPLVRRGHLLFQLDRTVEAYSDFREAVIIDPENGWTHLRLAQLAQKLGKMWKAANHAQKAIYLEPGSSEIRIQAAIIYRSLAWLDCAFRAVEPTPSDMPGWPGEVKAVAESSYREHSAATMQSLIKRVNGNNNPAKLAYALLKLGRLRSAVRLCEVAMRNDLSCYPSFQLYAAIVARSCGPLAAASYLRHLNFLHGSRPDHQATIAFMEEQASNQVASTLDEFATFMSSIQLLGSS